MKTSTIIIKAHRTFLSVLAIILMFSFTSCSNKISFLNSNVAPAARGYVKVKRDFNRNYVIQIHLSDLDAVKSLKPSKQTYIVWVVTDREITRNIGQVISSAKIFSKRHKVSFQTVSSCRPIRIFITAEDDASTQRPGMQDLITTNKFYK